MSKKNFAIANLQETMIKNLGFDFAKVFPSDCFYVHHNNSNQGMITLINKKFKHDFVIRDLSCGSTLAHSLKISTGVGDFNLLFIYCPPSSSGIPSSIRAEFLNHDTINGDLNTYTDCLDSGVYRSGRESDLANFLQDNEDFYVASNFISWKDDLDRNSGPDLTIARSSANVNFETVKGNLLLSDHFSVDNFGNFSCESKNFKQTVKKFDYDRLNSEEVEKLWDDLRNKPKMSDVNALFNKMLSICFSEKVKID